MEEIINILVYRRKITREVNIGGTALGGSNPMRIQTMTTTNTNNIDETVEQSIRAINVGAEYIRITTQGIKEAKRLGLVIQELRNRGYSTPIIADIHFNPKAALEAAKFANKIRINPGNYADKSRSSGSSISDIEYEQELTRVEVRFIDLLNLCKKNGVAIRIGVNQGSLSQRIMNRYGDTPIGMAHSAMEFLRICRRHKYHNLVVSMKSSNTRVMVQATRYLVDFMQAEGMDYPLHLGVTEAGEGEDGRLKSAVGIGTLLADGIGDTIRVSLTEEPEHEIPVAQSIVKAYGKGLHLAAPFKKIPIPFDPFSYNKRNTACIGRIGGENHPVVIANLSEALTVDLLAQWGWKLSPDNDKWVQESDAADYVFTGFKPLRDFDHCNNLPTIGVDPMCSIGLIDQEELVHSCFQQNRPLCVQLSSQDIDHDTIDALARNPSTIAMLKGNAQKDFYIIRCFFSMLKQKNASNPVILALDVPMDSIEEYPVMAGAFVGPFFIDGLGDGIMLSPLGNISSAANRSTCFGLLQASRVRISRTEYISCPGCGRTLFNLNETLLMVKERTSHLKGLKIGVMGCIVNGPGEMADADYGYVGSGPGKVTLYRRRMVVKKNIPENQAVDELIALIKIHGDWVDF